MLYTPPRRNGCCGFTIIEFTVALAILGIVFSFAIPKVSSFNDAIKFRSEQNQLVMLIQTARAEALNTNNFMAICHLESGECKDFTSPISVFSDLNNNRRLDTNEATTAILHLHNNTQLSWNKTSRIRFAATGRALNGTLKYCSRQSDTVKGFKIIIARTGRMRTESNSDHCG